MGFATPTFWRGGWVVGWQPELAEHGQPKQRVADTIVWLDTIHCNQRKRRVRYDDAREIMKMNSVLATTVVVEEKLLACSTVLIDSPTCTVC